MAQAAEAVHQSVATRPRLVFFFSRFSGKCRRVEGFIAQVLQRRQNHGTFVLTPVDVDERPELVERFGIDGVPALLVVSDRRFERASSTPAGAATSRISLLPG